MSWVTITAADFIAEGFTADERARLQAAAGGDDGLQGILDAAIAEWRGVIQAAGHDLDADTAKVPPSCRRHVIAQVRWQVLIKFPALPQLQTEQRKAEAEQAAEKLRRIEDGTARIESPDDPPADVTPGPRFGARERSFERADQDGL